MWKLALSAVSSNQDMKLSAAYTIVALEGAQHQAVRLAWNELLAEHTVGLEALRANPSNEEQPDFCQGS